MKTDRLLKIIYICLQRERVTAGELAEKLEVSRRTILRDLAALGAAGFPIVTYPGTGGGVGVMPGFKLDKSLLTDDELSKLAAALNSIHSVDGSEDVEFLMDKLLPPEKRNANSSDIIIDLSSWFEGDEIDDMFADVRAAIAQRRYISLGYSTKGVSTQRLVEPYKLVFKQQSWYLYAFCHTRGDFRMFKLTRIAGYTVQQRHFAERELGRLVFQLQGESGQGAPQAPAKPVEVVLAYHTQNRDYLMDRLGPQYFTDDGEEGTVRLTTTNLAWMADLVLSLQDRVEVLAPPQLRDEIMKRIQNMHRVYER